MSNSIPQTQNLPLQLERLAAQRFLYSTAKIVYAIQFFGTVVVPIILSIVANIYPTFKVWAALYGLIILIIDAAFIEYFLNSTKVKAAIIQEMFDSEVLSIPWHDSKVGAKLDPELVKENSKLYLFFHKDFGYLENWYPKNVHSLPIEYARIVCQRINCWWDNDLRRKYIFFNAILFCLLFIVSIVTGLVRNMSMQDFILVILAPLAPTFVWGIKEIVKQLESSISAEKLKSHANNLWSKALREELSPDTLTSESRQLQNEIFDRRKSSPLIFNFIYFLLRNRTESLMTSGADDFIAEYNGRKSSAK